MAIRYTIVLFTLLGGTALAQSGLQPGTNLTVQPGTTLRIEGGQTFSIGSGIVSNEGVIEFDEEATLDETPGFPITGAGVERTTRAYPAPMTGTDPAGLGFSITTVIAPGLLTLTRGHLPITDNGGMQGIARWFDVDAATNIGLNAGVSMHYDLTELNGLSEPALTLHEGAAGNYWNAFTTMVDEIGHRADASGLDSLGVFTLFDGISTMMNENNGTTVATLIPTLATEAVTVTVPTAMGDRQLVVMDATGRRVIAAEMRSTQLRIDVHALAPGRYEVAIDGVHAGSFMKP